MSDTFDLSSLFGGGTGSSVFDIGTTGLGGFLTGSPFGGAADFSSFGNPATQFDTAQNLLSNWGVGADASGQTPAQIQSGDPGQQLATADPSQQQWQNVGQTAARAQPPQPQVPVPNQQLAAQYAAAGMDPNARGPPGPSWFRQMSAQQPMPATIPPGSMPTTGIGTVPQLAATQPVRPPWATFPQVQQAQAGPDQPTPPATPPAKTADATPPPTTGGKEPSTTGVARDRAGAGATPPAAGATPPSAGVPQGGITPLGNILSQVLQQMGLPPPLAGLLSQILGGGQGQGQGLQQLLQSNPMLGQALGIATQGPYAGRPISQVPWATPQQIQEYRRTGQLPQQQGQPGTQSGPAVTRDGTATDPQTTGMASARGGTGPSQASPAPPEGVPPNVPAGTGAAATPQGIRITGRPPLVQGGNQKIYNDRARYIPELQRNPQLLDKVLRIMYNEQGNNPRGTQAIAESLFNRASMRGTNLETQARWIGEHQGYYAQGHGSRAPNVGVFNQQTRNVLMQSLNNALGGSNISNYATDNSSNSDARPGRPGLAARDISSGKFRLMTQPINGEYFFSPRSARAGWVPNYQRWASRMQQTPALAMGF